MTSKDIELIKEMLQMQEKLDEAIMKEYGLEEIEEEKLNMAILDEIGELTHELKANWCWWKKMQPKVDDAKVLEELVDVWHFILSYTNKFNDGVSMFDTGVVYFNQDYLLYSSKMNFDKTAFTNMLSMLIESWFDRLAVLTVITEHLGFTIKQVYAAYCDKNKINYQRLKEGY